MEPVSQRKRIQNIADPTKRKKAGDIFDTLILTDDLLQRIDDTFEEQIKFANSTDENEAKKSNLFWECTYVSKLLEGNENGEYLGLDLGGTNFRIVRVVFQDGVADTTTKYYNLSDELLTGPSSLVFDHIAESIEKFTIEEKLKSDRPIPLGFTFSFPSRQRSLKHSVLITWAKSFMCVDGPGLDPVTLLEQAIQRRGGLSIPVDVMARISDTTGTLMAGNYIDRNCRIGLILGTGSNACFVERPENFNKLDKSSSKYEQILNNIGLSTGKTKNLNLSLDELPRPQSSFVEILVNCEWGAFGDNGCLDFFKSEFDKELDEHSNHVNSYTFEKLFGGFYLGELVRLLLVKLARAGCLFDGKLSEKLLKRWNFHTKFVTAIEDDSLAVANTWNVLKEVDLDGVATEEDVALVQEACAVMSQRGAYIVATALAVLLHHIDLPDVTIAIDGSLYEHHPKYRNHMMKLLAQLAPKTKTKLILVKDGSGQGGAFVAAVETK